MWSRNDKTQYSVQWTRRQDDDQSDIKMPSGVESVSLSQGAEYDLTVATVNKQKAADIEEELDSDEADDDNAESEKESSED